MLARSVEQVRLLEADDDDFDGDVLDRRLHNAAQMRRVRGVIINRQRATLLELRDRGAYSSEALTAALSRLDATRNEVEAAARRANAHDFIESLSAGYETRVGERGVKLSGGQKQRICIARAFLANPRILLLDEATAAVEPESEHLILTALERLEEGRTAIIVSHRLPLVRDCDAILVLRDGKIAERGTHDELMARGGWYARMYLMQVEGVVS